MHGAGGNISTWKLQIPYFRKHFNLLLVELRGHGKSESLASEKPYTFESVASDIREVIDHIGIKKAHFLGLSIGSLIIHVYNSKYPNSVKSIVGTGGIYGITWKIHYFSKAAHFLTRIFPYHILYKLFAWIVMPKANHKVSRKIFVNASKKLHQREYIRWLNLYGTFRSVVRELNFYDQNISVLLVMGEEDHLFLKPAEYFSGLHKEVRLHVMKKCGHICNIEKPDEYNKIVHDFLNQ